MNRTEFLDTLRSQLSGQMHEGKVAGAWCVTMKIIFSHRYVVDAMSSRFLMNLEIPADRQDLLDTDVDNGQLDYEEYSTYSDDAQNTQSSSRNHVHVWRFDTWYSKLLAW